MSNPIITQEGSSSEIDSHNQQYLQISKAADGSMTVRGLFPGQMLFQLPNGRLSIISPNHEKISLQPGVTLVATGPKMPSVEKSARKEPVLIDNAVNFAVGDKIRMDPKVAFQRLQTQKLVGSQEDVKKFIKENVGTVSTANASKIIVRFPYIGSNMFLHFYAPFRTIEKLNIISVNQLIRIKSDVHTVMQIEMQFLHQSSKLKGAIGRVSGIDERDPIGKVFVEFDNSEVSKFLPKGASLPSIWMDPIQATNPSNDKERLELASKLVALFLKSMEDGDIRTAQLLVNRHGVDPESRNAEDRSALHVACQKGHKDLVEWLLDQVGVDVEHPDNKGFRAIHYAVLERKREILEMLMKREAQVNSRSNCGRTALHIAVMKQSVDCVGPLINNDADANIQDSEGNTPLHIALSNGALDCVDAMMPYFSFKWDLRNKDGFNIIHLAVVKNNYRAINFILGEQNMCDHLLELMPNSQATVLHFACVNKNYQMAKLLVDGSKGWMLLDGSPLLAKLLEARHQNGATALLIACHNKDYATVELLVESGADVKAVDQGGNTAILLAASNPASLEIPSKELCPAIYRVYQSVITMDSNDAKMMMESNPILSMIAYLKAKGASTERAPISGLESNQGSSGSISSPPTSVVATSQINQEIQEGLVDHDFNWIADETKYGHLVDRMGNKYTRTGTRRDGSVNFRCIFEASFGRCPSVARRSKNEVDGNGWTVKLGSGHIHLAAGLKRKSNQNEDGSPSVVKKERNLSGKKGK